MLQISEIQYLQFFLKLINGPFHLPLSFSLSLSLPSLSLSLSLSFTLSSFSFDYDHLLQFVKITLWNLNYIATKPPLAWLRDIKFSEKVNEMLNLYLPWLHMLLPNQQD